jgi:predicted nucleotidyltransferase/HEPN domain-containing protein
MQTDLSHLPENKRGELDEIVRLIREETEAEMINLYGSYARGDWKDEKDLDPERWSGQVSDYDLLVVVAESAQAEDELFWKRLEDKVNSAAFSAHVRPIVHDANEVNMALAEGRYFFRDLREQGRLLYDSGRFQLAEPEELGAEARQRLAKEYFDIWFYRAQQFYKVYEFLSRQDDLRGAAFELNQAAESAYKTILLVYTLYCPHEHLLDVIGRMATAYGPVFDEVFPQHDAQQRHCFTQLDRAYIGSRYQPRFKVSREELDYLAPRVGALLGITERLCREEIARLASEME